MFLFPRSAGPGSGRETVLRLEVHATIDEVAARLERERVVRRAFPLAVYLKIVGAEGHMRHGNVVVRDDMTPRELLRRLFKGYGPSYVRVTVPEGTNRFGVATSLEQRGVCSSVDFLAASSNPRLLRELAVPGPSAEGYLFPDTYEFRQESPPSEVVRTMVDNGRRRALPLLTEQASGMALLRSTLRWGFHEVLTLASIVEKEARARDEQPMIARVFLNRLRDPSFHPKRLEADPTVAYGCLVSAASVPSCQSGSKMVTRAMTKDPQNPYNTYRIERLPPGPISNPGISALRAVLHPAEHEYLYFVADGSGRHRFSRDHAAHTAAVKLYRGQSRKAR